MNLSEVVAASLLLALTAPTSCKSSAPELKPDKVPLAELTARKLPRLRSGSPLTGTSVNVLITSSELTLNDVALFPLPDRTTWAAGFGARYKRSGPRDLYIVPIADALRPSGDGGIRTDARIVVDGDVSYRILIEVLFTLGQSAVETAHLLVPLARTEAGISPLAQIDVVLPGPFSPTSPDVSAIDRAMALAMQAKMLAALTQSEEGSVPAGAPTVAAVAVTAPLVTARQSWFPSLSVRADGAHVRLYGYDGNHTDVGADCTLSRAGPTVERGPDGPVDLGALESCLKRLKAERAVPGGSDIIVTVASGTPYREFLRVIDAARGARGELFSNVRLGIDQE